VFNGITEINEIAAVIRDYIHNTKLEWNEDKQKVLLLTF